MGMDRQRWSHFRAGGLRADSASRRVEGIAVNYNSPTTIYKGVEEMFLPGAFRNIEPKMNATAQHDRSLPLGIPVWEDSDDAMRFSFELPPGARQDQMLSDVQAGLIRGASIEFFVNPDGETRSTPAENVTRYIVGDADLVGISLVDRPAYPRLDVRGKDEGPRRRRPCGRPGTRPPLAGCVMRLLSVDIVPLVVTDDMVSSGLSGIGSCDSVDDNGRRLMRGCAERIEDYCERLFWPGAETARTAVTEVEFEADDPYLYASPDRRPSVPWLPTRRNTRFAAADDDDDDPKVERFADSAWAEVAVTDLPGGSWTGDVRRRGYYRITRVVRVADPPSAVQEALARMFGWLNSRKPVWSETEGGGLVSFAGAVQKSGAASLLRTVCTRWPI